MDTLATQWGERIRTRRQRCSLTQAALAEAVGCTPTAVSRYEAGQRRPRHETQARIAAALGATVTDLFGW